MSKRCNYTKEEKLRILMEYENNYISVDELCKVYQINNKYYILSMKKTL